MMVFQHLERWLSGRKRQIANLLYGSKGRTEGSNPSLSVLFLANVHSDLPECFCASAWGVFNQLDEHKAINTPDHTLAGLIQAWAG